MASSSLPSLDASASHQDIARQLNEYAGVVDRILKPELVEAEEAAQAVRQEMDDYRDLGDRLQPSGDNKNVLPKEMMVDLGYQTLFCNAKIKRTAKASDSSPPPEQLFVHVGMGFHVELTVSEARDYIEKRLEYLQRAKLSKQEAKIAEIKDHIRSATMLLHQLQQEMGMTSGMMPGGE